MKTTCVFLSALAVATLSWGEPLRVALMDFNDNTGMKSEEALGGSIAPGALAAKGLYLLSEQLLGNKNFTLIDRRDFMDQVDKLHPKDMGEPTPTRPSFLQAAQALRADVVLRGSLLSFSSGKQVVDQGGYKTDFSTLSLRLTVEALDTVDGSVLAMADGEATGNFRQTKETYTVVSESDAINLMNKALGQAVPKLEANLEKRIGQQKDRPKIKLSVTTSADPALVEIDGILVGSTPLDKFEVYKGDHVLTVGKPGYQDITKRILFEKDATVQVPMLRTQLTADEWKDVLEKARLHLFNVDPGVVITEE
jgi:hypothetical protein